MREPRKAPRKPPRKRAPGGRSTRPESRSRRPASLRSGAAKGRDPGTNLTRAARAAVVEILKLGREMLAIPARLWMTAAEAAGAVTLRGWRLLRPPLVAAWRLLVAAERRAEKLVTPRRAVAAVAVAALVVLAASQWTDYSEVSVGTGAYSGGVGAVAPAPEIASARAGDAHAWLMLPLAAAGLVAVAAALAGRARAARWLVVVGALAILISLAVDLPKGLDEGSAAVAYEGAKASLLEGFWLQIVCGATLICCGVLFELRARPEGEPARSGRRARGLIKRLRVGRPAARPSA